MPLLTDVWLSDLKIRIAILKRAEESFGDVKLSEAIAEYKEHLRKKERSNK